MSTQAQGGIKQVATVPARLDSKRDRRRGAAGRASALRRAPSDSDCSAETASLSADSGDRVPRPLPPPPPSSSRKRGSRRRGSEWEVLEGLKDGQRFEKRPEVFNGYLHKKRKWPLKGWHKRFFVVDGGILVYARSPTDVARGRLHGSVDVGLSVISAKARRRRIDIDADEFIYHLRAKTPEVFRTWLNVLKAHRLYRQHLLTFGARESAPKILPPLDDLPATDTSSRSTYSSISLSSYSEDSFPDDTYSEPVNLKQISQINVFKYSSQHKNMKNKPDSYIKDLNECYDDYISIQYKTNSNQEIHLQSFNEKKVDKPKITPHPFDKTIIANPVLLQNKMYNKMRSDTSMIKIGKTRRITALHRYDDQHNEPIPTYFLFNRNKIEKLCKDNSTIQPSKKSINLPKYKLHKEPGLKKPLSKCLLQHIQIDPDERRTKLISELIPSNSDEIQTIINETKKTEEQLSKKQLEDITDKLLTSLKKTNNDKNPTNITKSYVTEVIKDLYDVSLQRHPIKLLFRSLLEYWVKENIKIKASLSKKPLTISKDTQSELKAEDLKPKKDFKVKIVKSQETQCYKMNNVTHSHVKGKRETKSTKNQSQSHEKISNKDKRKKETKPFNKEQKVSLHKLSLGDLRRNPSSFERDKRIQEIEKLLENTIYSNDTMFIKGNKDKQISITKTILESLKSELDVTSFDTYEEAIRQLSKSDSIPNYVVKEILTICLDVLSHDSFKLLNMPGTIPNKNLTRNFCDQSLIVNNVVNKTANQFINQENTTNFAFGKKKKALKTDPDKNEEIKNEQDKNQIMKTDVVDCKGNVVLENRDKNALYISLSKYDLNTVSMNKHPTVKDSISISIQLKEKPKSVVGSRANLRLTLNNTCGSSHDHILANCHNDIYKAEHPVYYIESTIKLDKKQTNEPKVLDSDGTSKSYCKIMYPTKYADSNNVVNQKHSSGYKSCSNYNNVSSYEDRDYTCCVLQHPSKYAKKMTRKFEGNPKNKVIRVPREVAFKANPSPSFENPNQKLILDNLNLLSETLPRFREDIHSLMNRLPQIRSTSTNTPFSPEGGLGYLFKEGEKHYLIDTQNVGVEANYITKCNSHGNNTKEVIIVHPENLIDRSASAITFPKMSTLSAAISALKLDIERKKWFNLVRCPIEVMNIKGTSCPFTQNVNKTTVDASVQYIKEHIFETTNRSVNTSTRIVLQRMDTPYNLKANYLNEIRTKNIDYLSDSIQSSKSILHNNISNKRDFKRNYQINQMSLKKCRLGPMRSISSIENCNDEFGFRRRTSVHLGLLSPSLPTLRGPQAGFVSGTPGGRLAGWIVESGGPLETVSREITQAQLSVQQLRRLLEQLELQLPPHHHDTDVSLEGASPNVKSSRRKFGLRKKKSSTKCASVELQPPTHLEQTGSHMALSALTAPPSPGGGASSVPNSASSLPIACAAARPQSLPAAEAGPASLSSLTPPTDVRLREDFTVLAKDLVHSCQCILSTLVCERNRLRAAMEEQSTTPAAGVVTALRTNLNTALQQNSELRTRLSRIHDASDLAEISSMNDAGNHKFQQSLSYSSSCVSASEFFDAEEHEDEINKDVIAADEAGVIELDGDSTSEAGSLSSEDGSASSDNSDAALVVDRTGALSSVVGGSRGILGGVGGTMGGAGGTWTRRTTLPVPRAAPAGPSLWHLLYKNIGKDLSQISMPVTINEPLNMLQRLCEELEYSELVEAACAQRDPVERMCAVAAFAVSAYAATAARAASKPFNPLLHETYECVRDDRSFRFLAEQVSHHPPVSACHASSPRWVFWQDARIKTKFWGKSMEFQPTGNVHLRLLNTGDHYTWNKVTTCVHNLFGGQRWVDQYGDMVIKCHGSDIQCKLHFIKASSWSSSRHEVSGLVRAGGRAVRLRGRWSEALYCGEPAARCLWRRAAMPPDHELYYGFTQFAMELNELEPGMKDVLPHTDTRLRPDQRALECGDIDAAEQYKMQLEQAQRDRRKDGDNRSAAWFKRVVEDGEETWVFNGEYWKARESGFSEDIAPRLW